MINETNHIPDDTLAKRVQAGDRPAFAQLVERHADRFYRVAYWFLRNRNEAEDMVQTAFLKFLQQPEKWDISKKTRFTTWFYRVVVNLCLDHLKKKKSELRSEEINLGPSPTSIEEDLELRKQKILLEKHLQDLPERQRTALNLCFYEGLSNREAAEIMGVKLKALQSLLIRAKRNLKTKVIQQKMGRSL